MTAEACPLSFSSDCNQECQIYEYIKAVTNSIYHNVSVILSDFTNTPREFNRKIGKRYEFDSIPGIKGQACYHKSNAEVGCKEIIEVEEGACSWKYECDYNKNRLPLYIWRASCNNTQTIYYPVPILKYSDACIPQPTWQLVMEKIPVGCRCQE
jgi:hypothetical protein